MHGCDHRTICRFEGDTSNGYKIILGVLMDVAEETKESQSTSTLLR